MATSLATLGWFLFSTSHSLAAEDATGDEALDEIVVVGTRTAGRSPEKSPVPVDVITLDDIRQPGAIGGEVGALLQSLVPSFNFPRQSNSNFADLVRPAQLRSLSPDQVLVLVNGKRRHGTATLTTESKLGKGTSPVDLNSIPVSAIARIEILRDNASAQYGSDAIAGVINIVLKDATEGGEASVVFGQHRTDFDPTSQSIDDGDTLLVSANAGFGLGANGFLNLTGEYRDREQTRRSGLDQIPFFERQTAPNLALLGTQTHKAGDGPMEDFNLLYNAGYQVTAASEFYTFGTYSHREGEGANFFRYPDSFSNVPAIFPDGFIPVLDATVDDFSLALGLRGTTATEWFWDVSAVYGSNDFDHDITNSLNVSLGTNSPTSFNVGEYKLSQWGLRFDMSKPFELGRLANPVNFAWGLEYRSEAYETTEGDLESYIAGPNTNAPIGTQAGSGLQPSETVDEDRDASSIYIDLESNLTDRFLLGAAARFEDYSDFGSSLNGKLSARYEFVPQFAVRGAAGTGFRAPSLTQAFFRGSTTSFGTGGQLEQVLNLPTDDPIARLLGAQDLEAEESVSYSVGLQFRTDAGFSLTVDYYRVDIDDRITLSERIGGTEVTDFINTSLGIPNVRGVRFFTNAVDTETDGVDVVAQYAVNFNNSVLTLSAGYNKSDTEVVSVDPNPPVLDSLGVGAVLFGVEELNTLETAAPEYKLILTSKWASDKWSILGRATQYGETKRVFNFGGGFEPEQTYGENWSLDLDVEFRITEAFAVAVGGNNILDEYPDRSSADINFFGNLPYDVVPPVGFNGAFFYLRGTYDF